LQGIFAVAAVSLLLWWLLHQLQAPSLFFVAVLVALVSLRPVNCPLVLLLHVFSPSTLPQSVGRSAASLLALPTAGSWYSA
jgi:hypothetical protein